MDSAKFERVGMIKASYELNQTHQKSGRVNRVNVIEREQNDYDCPIIMSREYISIEKQR